MVFNRLLGGARGAVALALLLTGPLAQAADAALDRVAWLAGCWRSEGAEPGSGEQWLAPAGGTLLGVSRSVRRGATVAHEFMQIRQQDDGTVVFITQPAGVSETVYTLLPGAATEVVFENLANDFPQRIVYRLEEGTRLRLRLESQRSGPPRNVEMALGRAACDAQPALPEAFQGLPWGASESQLALRFGAALKRAECGGPGSRMAARPHEACDHPVVLPYEVAGLPFRLNLHVDDRARQLVRVSLAYERPVEAAAGNAPDTGWGEKHRVLRQLLTQRYGGPESTNVANDPGVYTATARWRRGDTLIELHSVFLPRSAAGPPREQVEIVYQPSAAGEAGKL